MLAFFDAERDQSFCNSIPLVAVLAIIQPEVEADFRIIVNERLLVRNRFGLTVEQVADGEIDQLDAATFSFPDGSVAFDAHSSCLINILTESCALTPKDRARSRIITSSATSRHCNFESHLFFFEETF